MLGPTEPWKNGENWFPRFYISNHTTPLNLPPLDAIPEQPLFADYPEHTCRVCLKRQTTFEMCGPCQIAYLEPVYGALRQAVHDGSRSDFGDVYNHQDMQAMWEAAPDRWHGWQRIARHIFASAQAAGFKFGNFRTPPEAPVFWPEDFNESEEAA